MAAVTTTGPVSTPIKRTYAGGVGPILRGIALVQGAVDSQLIPAAAANAPAFAIAEEATIYAGDPLSAVLLGDAVAIAGAAVAAGQLVITNAAGQLVPTVAAGDNIVGRAISSAAVAGDEFLVLVNPSIR